MLRNTKLVGLLFIALLLTGVWFTFAIFTKKFADYDEVSLETSSVGLQLPERADVKMRGVIVGEVLDMSASNDGAELKLGLYPSQVDTIPSNVTARIEPKTLFGEKYVALQIPEQPAGDHIEAGDTIKRSVVATEVEETLNDLYPLLRTVQPAELNKTLNALATALEGRGDRLGENLVTLDGYLKRINPQIPALVEDLRLLSDTSDLYSDVFPDIATTLRNSVTTGNTLKGREEKLNKLFDDVTGFSNTTRTFLAENDTNIIRVNQLAAQQLRVFAKYSPEFPCLTSGIVNAGKLQAAGVPRVHPAHQPRAAAQPAACLRAAGQAAVRRQAGSLLRHPARLAVQPEEHRTVPQQRGRRRRRADRQGHQPRRPALGGELGRRRQPPRRPTSCGPSWPPRWAATPRRCPT